MSELAEGARLESVYGGNSIVGSNPTRSAIFLPPSSASILQTGSAPHLSPPAISPSHTGVTAFEDSRVSRSLGPEKRNGPAGVWPGPRGKVYAPGHGREEDGVLLFTYPARWHHLI